MTAIKQECWRTKKATTRHTCCQDNGETLIAPQPTLIFHPALYRTASSYPEQVDPSSCRGHVIVEVSSPEMSRLLLCANCPSAMVADGLSSPEICYADNPDEKLGNH
jgi:hypothetical protein